MAKEAQTYRAVPRRGELRSPPRGAGRRERRAPTGGLEVPRLVAKALRTARAAEGEEGGLRFLPPLEQLVETVAAEAHLTTAGKRSTAESITASLVTQLRLERAAEEQPEVERAPIEAPVFVVGLHRTGTTLLQNLLAQHPGVHAPLLWELLHPVTPVRTAADRRRLVEATDAYVRGYYRAAPALRAIHFLHPELPEECHRLLGTTFTSEIFGIRYRVPSYLRWLEAQDAREAYRHHRRLLAHVLARGPGGPAVLKCPTHLSHLDSLGAVYPDARLVRLHRDPVVAVASASSLTAVVRSARSDAVDKHEIGRERLEQAVLALARARRALQTRPLPVLDLRYRDLVADPLGTVATVCDFAGLPLGRTAERRMRRFLDADPHEGGRHAYTLEEFGLDPARTAARFADYRAELAL